jgi:hypothetical protein
VLPFTAAQFFDMFARYNEAVWPAPLVPMGWVRLQSPPPFAATGPEISSPQRC